MSRIITIKGRGVIAGIAEGPALIGEAIQGNAALDYQTGEIIQVGHSLRGMRLQGGILVIAGARGSTAWSVRLHTTLINGVGPAGMVFPRMDARTAGAAAAMRIPVVTDLQDDIFALVEVGDRVKVDGTRGLVEVEKQ
jgi:predicted aconitase with swiveling domain